MSPNCNHFYFKVKSNVEYSLPNDVSNNEFSRALSVANVCYVYDDHIRLVINNLLFR